MKANRKPFQVRRTEEGCRACGRGKLWTFASNEVLKWFGEVQVMEQPQ